MNQGKEAVYLEHGRGICWAIHSSFVPNLINYLHISRKTFWVFIHLKKITIPYFSSSAN